jgi:hypothetical protein
MVLTILFPIGHIYDGIVAILKGRIVRRIADAIGGAPSES